jgi:hypothetical protein
MISHQIQGMCVMTRYGALKGQGVMDRMFATLEKLGQVLQAKELPRAAIDWRSQDVTIAPSRKGLSRQGHDSYHVFVVTKYASEVSWYFEQLVPAFCVECKWQQPKEPFARRLALAAITCKRRVKSPGARRLCKAVWHEAYAVYDEILQGKVQYPSQDATDLGDDEIDEAFASGFISPRASRQRASRGQREAK